MSFGTKLKEGTLPVYSVGTEKEAQSLITLTCPTSEHGEYFAPELAQEQTLENLQKFSDRLHTAHQFMVERGNCTCLLDTNTD